MKKAELRREWLRKTGVRYLGTFFMPYRLIGDVDGKHVELVIKTDSRLIDEDLAPNLEGYDEFDLEHLEQRKASEDFHFKYPCSLHLLIGRIMRQT